MKSLCCLLLCLANLAFAASESRAEAYASASLPEQMNPAESGRIILVGFYDQSIERPSVPVPLSGYRRRGDYQTTTWSRRTSQQIAEDYRLQKVGEWPMTEVGVHCVIYKIPGASPIQDTIALMSKDSRIKVVQPMHWFGTRSRHQYNDPYFKLQTNLQGMQLDRVHNLATGRRITIGMIDTGLDPDHPDLSGQIGRQENLAGEVSPGFADDLHGTAVAGVMVARKDNGVGIAGVAPDASLIALKACWPQNPGAMAAVCNSYTLALAINTAIRAKVDVLNMSLGGPDDPLLALLLNKAIENGIVVVAADAGQDSLQNNFPANLPHVIPVQAASNKESAVSHAIRWVEAPGDNILTTLPRGSYDFISGSSIAAAQVSGLVALMLELNPGMPPDQIKSLLLQSQKALSIDPKHKQGVYAVDANQAIGSLCRSIDCNGDKFAFAWFK